MISIGLDVGGTKVLGVAVGVDEPANVLAERRVPTPDGGTGLVDVLLEVAGELAAEVGEPLAHLGVGVPGLVDRTGRLLMGAHVRHLVDVPLADLLRERSTASVTVDNDASCAAVGEQACGAAAGRDDVVVVTLGTGIGAGIIAGGQLVRGARGYAGEPGHMLVMVDGPLCECGNRGCWEQLASGSAFVRRARQAAVDGRLAAVLEGAGGNVDAVRGEDVMAAARAGDPEAKAVATETAKWVAVGLAALVNILDPALLVIGGGLVEGADVLLPDVQQHLDRLVLGGGRRPVVPVVPAALGERSGAIGAAVLARRG